MHIACGSDLLYFMLCHFAIQCLEQVEYEEDYLISSYGANIQSLGGGGGAGVLFEINMLILNFHEINNFLKDML